MNVFFSFAAQAAFNAASADIKSQANSLLGSYSSYLNRHYLPGKTTLQSLRKETRKVLGLPAGTPVFECGERRHRAARRVAP